MDRFSIHPRIGVARLGNSTRSFYLGPRTTGGLPTECDSDGNEIVDDGSPRAVTQFKDAEGAIKRQAARFAIYAPAEGEDGVGREVHPGEDGVASITWTVHVANKKPIWYTFSELNGDLEFGEWNTYENQHVPLNNAAVTDSAQRRQLMIDPGPRSVDTPGERAEFSRYTIPADYPHGSFPDPITYPLNPEINTLGEMMMDASGRLVVLGGYGNSAGTTQLTGFRGASVGGTTSPTVTCWPR